MSPVGYFDCVDVTIASVNHYITFDTGLANKNCWIGWDELGNYPTDEGYRMLLACNRWAEAEIPTKRIRASANPGGPGHSWLKRYFKIDSHPHGYEPYDDPISKRSRMYIPSRVTDNKILLASDPTYIDTLKAVGSPELVRAWLDGDWNAVTGAYFTEFNVDKHVIEPFEIPYWWLRFACMDWGYAKPFAIYWIAVSDGKYDAYPAGSLVVYREWYGTHPDEIDVGLRLDVGAVASGILERTPKDEKLTYLVVDPAMYKEDGGPSMAEILARRGINVRRGDNQRVPGWQELRRRLVGEDGYPLLYLYKTCHHLIRTLPTLQHDRVKAEDCDSDGPDHAADALRYGVMSRMWVKGAPPPETKRPKWLHEMSLNDLLEHESQSKRRDYSRI